MAFTRLLAAKPLSVLLALAFACVLHPAVAAPPATADQRFEALSKRYIDEFGRYSPVSATQLGDHRFDGELDDLSAAGRARSLAWTKGVLGELQAIERARLSRANQVDAAMLDNQLRYAIWTEEKFRDWSWDPLIYTQLAGSRCTACSRAISRRCRNGWAQ